MSVFRKGQGGIIYQSGLRVGSRNEPRPPTPGGVYRAVVISTYASDEDANPTDNQVYCDVVLLRSQTPIPGVLVAVAAGLNNADVWLPRATTATISGQPLRLNVFDNKGRYEGAATPVEDMNGDVVLLQFADDSVNFPVITGRFTHQKSRRPVTTGDGWSNGSQDTQRGAPEKNERFTRFQGVEHRVNNAGDVLVDTVGATSDENAQAATPLGGDVRYRIKRGRAFTVAAGSVGGVGDAGGEALLEAQQDLLGATAVKFAGSDFTLSRDALGNITFALAGTGVRLTKPVVGPAQLQLLSGTAPMLKGPALNAAILTFAGALLAALTTLAAGPVATTPITKADIAIVVTALTAAIAALTASLTASLSLTVSGE